MVVELLILVALALANGLFAGAEIAVLTAAKPKVQQRAQARDRRALAVESLRAQPERFLATVQIGITVVGVAAAAFGGASIARDLAPTLEGVFGGSADEVAMVLVIALVSFLSLVVGELVPKSLALRYATGYAFAIGRPLLGLARLMRPLVWFLTACSNLVLRLFGDRTSFTEARISREEVRQVVEDAAKAGSVDPKSSEIATRALEFGDVMVAEVMIPRDEIVAVPRGASPTELQRVFAESGRSRIPVYEGVLDRVVGYVVARDVVVVEGGKAPELATILRPMVHVPVAARIGGVLRTLQHQRAQIAIAIDEQGHTAGLVTMEDLVEELVGDIVSEDESPEETIELAADGCAVVAGWVPTRKVNRALHVGLPISRDSATIAGLCLSLALAVPAPGTTLVAPDGTRLEVLEASPRRVRTVRVHPAPVPEPGGPQ